MHVQLSDTELVNRYQYSGDTKYVGELYTRYTGFAFSVCLKYLKNRTTAEDAVMHIFEKLFDSLHKHSPENFKPWLYSVIKNYCFEYLRSSKTGQEICTENFSDSFMENDEDLRLTEKIELEEKLEQFEQQLRGLSEEQKICVELFYVRRLCYKDISEKTGYNLPQVKSYIQNGKRNLQIRIQPT